MKYKLLTKYVVTFLLLGGIALIVYAENELKTLNSNKQLETTKNASNCTNLRV